MAAIDRSDFNRRLDINNYFPPFISMCILHRNRPDYLLKCVDSIHQYADMPVEIVVHDDGSSRDVQGRLFNDLKDKVSSLIYNFGRNTAIANPANRCIRTSKSKYILLFHEHVYMESGFLHKIKTALDLPYVGLVSMTDLTIPDGPLTRTTADGVKVQIGLVDIKGCYFGFRRDVYDQAGPWDENVQFAFDDISYFGQVFSKGYFNAVVEAKFCNYGLSPKGPNDKPYVPSSMDGGNNAPRLFNLSEDVHREIDSTRGRAIWESVNNYTQKDTYYPTWPNIYFYGQQTTKLYPSPGIIDWNFAKEYGHDRWKETIIRDFPGVNHE